MTFEEILHQATTEAALMVDGQEFNVIDFQKIKLASGDRLIWLWDEVGRWLVVDADGHEIIFLSPIEEEVGEEEEEFITYLGQSYEEMYEDGGSIDESQGEHEHEAGDVFEFKQYESERGEVLRRLNWSNAGEEAWFYGKMITEDDIRPL